MARRKSKGKKQAILLDTVAKQRRAYAIACHPVPRNWPSQYGNDFSRSAGIKNGVGTHWPVAKLQIKR